MNLNEERYSKKSRLVKLERLIEEQRQFLKQEQEKLDMLEEEYNNEKKSVLPILLFRLNETIQMPVNAKDWIFEYVYYLPDLDDFQFIFKHTAYEFLPNTLDLRESFKNMGVPEYAFPERAYDYQNEISEAAATVKMEIHSFIKSNPDTSWEELGEFLLSKFKKDDIKKRQLKK